MKKGALHSVSASLLALLVAGQSGVAQAAAPVNQIPSCYAVNPVGVPAPKPEKHLFVLIDQTTPLDDSLKHSLATITRDLVRPGTAFSVYSFSAYSQGRYLDLQATGVIETSIPKDERGSIGVKVLKNFDKCMAGQYRYGLSLAMKAEQMAVQQSSSKLQKSDVIAAVAEISRQVKESTAPNKIVLIVSDMLENSSISSFYSKNAARRIEPEKELASVAQNKLFGDFGGASIYVMGAGMVHETDNPVYRDPKTMRALADFWSAYFAKSNARLMEFGQPALLNQIR